MKPNKLAVDELVNTSEKIGRLIRLSSTGGEPFLREDFKEITSAFIQNINARYVRIPINASMPNRIVHYLEYFLPHYPNTH